MSHSRDATARRCAGFALVARARIVPPLQGLALGRQFAFPRASPWAGLFRPLRGGTPAFPTLPSPGRRPGLVCFGPFGAEHRRFRRWGGNSPSPGRRPGLVCFGPFGAEHRRFRRCLPQGVALGWFVSAPSGRNTGVSGVGVAIRLSQGVALGSFVSAPFGAEHRRFRRWGGNSPSPGRCPGLLCFGALRGGTPALGRQFAFPRASPWAGWFSAPSGRNTGVSDVAFPRASPWAVCFGPFGAEHRRFRRWGGNSPSPRRRPGPVGFGPFGAEHRRFRRWGGNSPSPRRRPGLVCFGPLRGGTPAFPALGCQFAFPRASPWAGWFRPRRGGTPAFPALGWQFAFPRAGWFRPPSGRNTGVSDVGLMSSPGRRPGLVGFRPLRGGTLAYR
jgi:hypothetical protein